MHNDIKLAAKHVRRYYFDHFEELDAETKVQFAWPLHAWHGDKEAHNHLLALKPYLLGTHHLDEVYQHIAAISQSNTHSKGKMVPIHQKYFGRHPGLLEKTWQLLHLLRVRSIFGIDLRKQLLMRTSLAELDRIYRRIHSDPEAIAMLSAAAVNFMYLYKHLILDDIDAPDPHAIVTACTPYYDMHNAMHIKLFSYLYTHLVINASNFFCRHIPETTLATYRTIMDEAEQILEKYYSDISLDNKFEFLTCKRLVKDTSLIETRIDNEALGSFVKGTWYTADALNNNPNKYTPSLNNMAHTMIFLVLSKKGSF